MILFQEESGLWHFEIRDGHIVVVDSDYPEGQVLTTEEDFEGFWDMLFEQHSCYRFGSEILNVIDRITPALSAIGIELTQIERVHLNRTYEVLLGIKVPGIYEGYQLFSSTLEGDGEFEDDTDPLTKNEVLKWKASYRRDLENQLAQLN